MFTLVCLGASGEYATVLDGSQFIKSEGRVVALAEGIFQQQSVVSIPMMWGVQWTDAGPAGVSVKVRADAVSRRPRQEGPFTFESFQEIVATKVRIRLVSQRHTADRDRKVNSAFEVFSQLRRRLVSLYTMARGGLHSEPHPAHLFTQTFLSGVIFEDLVLEVVRDGGVGRLHSRTMSIAPDGLGWILQGVQVEGTDGRRLTIHEAIWSRNGRIVAHGPYLLEESRKRTVGRHGCFLVRLSDAVEIRGPFLGNAALCAPNLLLIQDRSGLLAMAALFPKGGGVRPNLQVVPLIRMAPFLALPASSSGIRGSHRADRLN